MTLESVRNKTGRIREFSALPFMLVAAVSLAGVFVRPAAQEEQEEIGLDLSQHGEVMQDTAPAVALKPIFAKTA